MDRITAIQGALDKAFGEVAGFTAATADLCDLVGGFASGVIIPTALARPWSAGLRPRSGISRPVRSNDGCLGGPIDPIGIAINQIQGSSNALIQYPSKGPMNA